jgi:hypothetical protein
MRLYTQGAAGNLGHLWVRRCQDRRGISSREFHTPMQHHPVQELDVVSAKFAPEFVGGQKGSMVMRHELKAEYIICGVEIDQSCEGPCISVTKAEIHDDDRRYTNCIQIQYGVSIESDDAPLSQSDINRIIMEEVGPLPQCLSLLLVHPSHLLNYDTRLDGNGVKLELPARDAPLGLYSLAPRWNWRPSPEIQRYSSRVPNDSWPILESLMSEYRQRPVAVRRKLMIPLRWFAKASNEMAGLDRLVAYWISFNSMYRDSAPREQDSIEVYMANIDGSIAHRYVEANEGLLGRLSIPPN